MDRKTKISVYLTVTCASIFLFCLLLLKNIYSQEIRGIYTVPARSGTGYLITLLNKDRRDKFRAETRNRNYIYFESTENELKNTTPLTGTSQLSIESTNKILKISSGVLENEYLYERYLENDGTNQFIIHLMNDCFFSICSMDEQLSFSSVGINYSCSQSTEEVIDTRLKFTFDSKTTSYQVGAQSNTFGSKDSNKTCLIPMYYDDGTNGKHPVTSVESYRFNACYFENLYLPSSITKIENGGFNQCFNLTSVYLPDSVTSIGAYSIAKCKKLTNVRLSENLLTIGDNSFEQDELIESLYIPDSVTYLGSSAFLKCYKIKTVNCPKGVTALEGSTFYYDDEITSFTFTSNIKNAGYHFFRECDNIENISYEGTIEEWGKVKYCKTFFTGCPKITKVTCSDGDYTL